MFLERQGAVVRSRTIATLRERLRHAVRDFGDISLRELARMTNELAAWQTRQPERVRHARMSALRQCLAAGVRWATWTATRRSRSAATRSRRRAVCVRSAPPSRTRSLPS